MTPDQSDHDRELVALAEFRNPGRIQRVEEDGGVRYKNICLLAPGIWTDAGSRQTIEYAGEAIRESADDWIDTQVNLLHGPALHNAEVLGEIGEVRPNSLVVDDEDRLFGDVYLHEESPASELAVELMDEVLEAAEDPSKETPPVGPSVEIAEDETRFDEERGLEVMTEMTFAGLGIVFGPASKPVEMEQQVRERAVAMSEEGESEGDVAMIRTIDDGEDDGATQSLKTGARPGRLMADEREQLERLLEDLEETKTELEELLQSDDALAMVEAQIAQFEQDGNDLQAPATEFVEWLEANADVDMDAVQEVLEAYLESVEAESLEETPVEGLAAWIQETAGDPEGEDPEGGEEGENEGEMSSDDLREAVDTISEYASELETVKDMLAEAEDAREERSERLEELDRRLQELEDEPDRRSLEQPSESEFVETDAGGGESGGEHEDVLL